MSEVVSVHQFVTTPLETVDAMGEAVWRGLQPEGDGARAIRAALDRIDDARIKAESRIERLQDERRTALLRGSASSVESVDARLRRASLWLERVSALAAELPAALATAEAREAEAAHALTAQRAAARVAIERYRKWVNTDYPKLAAAIAAGIAMERDAIAGAAIAGITAELPRAYTTAESHPRGMPPTTFGHMVRLPNHVPGPPLVWPPGELHPDLRAPTPLYRQD